MNESNNDKGPPEIVQPVRLSDVQKNRLQDYADRHYEGNLSMAIRLTIRRGLDIVEDEEESGERKTA